MATKKLVCHCNQALRAATTSAMNKNSAEILVNSKVDLNRNNLDHSFVIPKYSIKDEMEKVDRLDLTGEVCQKYQLYEETFNEKSRKRQINFIMPEPPKTPVLDPRDTHLAENRYVYLMKDIQKMPTSTRYGCHKNFRNFIPNLWHLGLNLASIGP